MPNYGFECYSEDGGCGLQFDIACSMDEILGLKPKCPSCNKKKPVARYFDGSIRVTNSTPTTVGALADRNASRMSNDEKHDIETRNRIQKPKYSGSLPEGGSLLPVDSEGKKIAPTHISKKKPGRPKNV